MSIEIFTSRTGDKCMVSYGDPEIAFGPVFSADENPQDFIEWLKDSPREYPDVRVLLNQPYIINSYADEWRMEVENEAEAAGVRASTEPEAWEGGIASNH